MDASVAPNDGWRRDQEQEKKAELSTVLRSPLFQRAPGQSSILRYVCEKHLAGEDEVIKEYNIAVEALGRPADFDQSSNSIVRMSAQSLRKRLAQYYETEGAGHRWRIQLAKSGYLPEFVLNGHGATTAVENGPPKAAPEEPDEPLATAPRRRSVAPQPPTPQGRPRRIALVALAMMVSAAVGWFIGLPSMPTAGAGPHSSVLTTFPGLEVEPGVAPGGDRVAFAWNGPDGNNFDIYTIALSGGKPLRLTTGPAEEFSPAWSPDGRSIAFMRGLDGERAEIVRIDSFGGEEEVLGVFNTPGVSLLRSSGPLMAWTPDSQSILVSGARDSRKTPSLHMLSLATGDVREMIPPLVGSSGDAAPAFSPDGRTLAFVRRFSPFEHAILAVRLSENFLPVSAPWQVAAGGGWNRSPTWTPDGQEIVFADRGLKRADAFEPGGATAIPEFGFQSGSPAVSPEHGLLVYVNGVSERNIWRIRLAQPAVVAGAPQLWINGSAEHEQPVYSPDGSQIAYASIRDGRSNIWICSAQGEDQRQITFLPGARMPRWSPDGTQIAFQHSPEGTSDISVVDVETQTLRRITSHRANDIMPNWSGDGRWLYFASLRTGSYEVWRVPIEGGEPEQLTNNGGMASIESSDGSALYYAKYGGESSIWRLSLADGGEEKIIDLASSVSFAVSGDGIYFVARAPGDVAGRSLLHCDFESKDIRTVLKFDRPVGAGLSLSPDGRFLLFTQTDHSESDLVLVENFQ